MTNPYFPSVESFDANASYTGVPGLAPTPLTGPWFTKGRTHQGDMVEIETPVPPTPGFADQLLASVSALDTRFQELASSITTQEDVAAARHESEHLQAVVTAMDAAARQHDLDFWQAAEAHDLAHLQTFQSQLSRLDEDRAADA